MIPGSGFSTMFPEMGSTPIKAVAFLLVRQRGKKKKRVKC
jgi:hypothetical protein